ncbi:hypothetical protein NM688_g8120 [Phlebia brevispora]|uniref:Uncharacterized protein n=1 Tax=Phlebia brevispora TaxID=194682 RepID=A0ACC1RX13_9APHY|nr:hypothetical protein NM688_g8120 [Phlebia brevispora]
MGHLLPSFLRRSQKSRVAAAPSNVDPERQPPSDSEHHSARTPSGTEAPTEGPSPARSSPDSSSNAGSRRGALKRWSSRIARILTPRKSRVEERQNAETRPMTTPNDESAAEERSHSELPTVNVRPDPEPAVEVASAPETHLAKFFSAWFRGKAEQRATAPSGSDSGADALRCRYLGERPSKLCSALFLVLSNIACRAS